MVALHRPRQRLGWGLRLGTPREGCEGKASDHPDLSQAGLTFSEQELLVFSHCTEQRVVV